MASRSLDDLSPVVRAKALAFLSECRACGLDVLVYCTLRSNAEQDALYALGRSKKGAIVTGCRGGESRHNPDADGKSHAFDAVPLLSGKPLWGDAPALLQMGICGEAVGLVWAGRWRGALRERVHFQGPKS